MGVYADGIDVLNLPKDDFAPHMSLGGYVELALAFICFWVLMHCFLHVLLMNFVKLYREQVGRDVHEYRQYLQAFIHAVSSVILSVYCTFYSW